VGDRVYKDGRDITPEGLFSFVDAGENCRTAAVNVFEYIEYFRRLRQTYEKVVHVSLGSGFSSSHQNAKLAAAEVDGIYVVDSENLSTGTGLLVCRAAELAQAGRSAEEICEAVTAAVPKVETSFILSRLDYMAKGGRCSGITAQTARILQLRPCIEVVDGKMVVGRKYRGKLSKCLTEYVRHRLEGRSGLDLSRIFITHTVSDREVVEEVKETLAGLAGFQEVLETTAGCTIANHCGPDTLGILFMRA